MTEDERRWMVISMASQTLLMAVLGLWDHAYVLVQRIEAEAGGEAVLDAMIFWVDAWLGIHGKPPEDIAVRLAFRDLSGGPDRDADDVPPEIAWAGRFMAARAAGDDDQIVALINSVPKDAEIGGSHVQALLFACAGNLQHMAGLL